MTTIARQRLSGQRLVHSACASPAEVVRTLGAMQAQNAEAALWAVGARLPGGRRDDVARAIADRRLVRTWALRGTLHLLDAADARWLPGLVARRVLAAAAGREAQLGLDAATFRRGRRLLEKALRDGPLTREATYAALERGGVATAGQRGYHVLWRLGLEGLVCFGEPAGRQPTFALVDAWLPPAAPPPDRATAVAELAGRYFPSRGPATAHDFAAWSGLTMAEARAGLAAVAPGLDSFERDGQTYWLPPAAAAPRRRAPAALLLPAFDEYLLAYRDRGAVLSPEHASRVVPGANGMFLPLMVLRGRVVGTWKAAPGKRSVRVDCAPFAPLAPADRAAFAAAARRYGAFLGLDVTVCPRGFVTRA